MTLDFVVLVVHSLCYVLSFLDFKFIALDTHIHLVLIVFGVVHSFCY